MKLTSLLEAGGYSVVLIQYPATFTYVKNRHGAEQTKGGTIDVAIGFLNRNDANNFKLKLEKSNRVKNFLKELGEIPGKENLFCDFVIESDMMEGYNIYNYIKTEINSIPNIAIRNNMPSTHRKTSAMWMVTLGLEDLNTFVEFLDNDPKAHQLVVKYFKNAEIMLDTLTL